MNDLSFRPMATADIESVAALSKRADPFGWTVANFQSALAAGYDCVVALAAGKIAGYRIVMQVFDETELLEIAVDPEFQGRGFGRALLMNAMTDARKRAGRLMRLEVRIGNTRALRLYESAGFKRVGVRRGYYPAEKGREDAVLMDCRLTEFPAGSHGF